MHGLERDLPGVIRSITANSNMAVSVEEGVLEDDVHLDQVVSAEGDTFWYKYEFGDRWDHVLQVEEVPDEPPTTARRLGARMACPPEDWGMSGEPSSPSTA